MNRKLIACLLLSMLVLGLLASCSILQPGPDATPTVENTQLPTPTRTSTPPPTPTEVVIRGTISIWHSWEDARLPVLLKQIDAFRAEYPDVQFDVQYVPAVDLLNSFRMASIEGRAPSILIGPSGWGPRLYEEGWVADLASIAPSDVLNILNPAAVETGRYHGALLSLPISIEGVVLYRNAANIPVSPATFDDLISLSLRVTKGEVVGCMLDRSFFFSGGHLEGLGGRLMDEDGLPVFDDSHGIDWINLLKSFERAGPTDFLSDTDVQLFKEGRVGLMIESTSRRQELADALNPGSLAIDPWPIYQSGGLSGFVQAESVYLTPAALQEPQRVSWMFFQRFFSSETQSAVAESGDIPAINGSPVILSAARVQVSDDLIQQAMAALADGVAYPSNPAIQAYQGPLDLALKSVFEADVPPEEALQAASQAISTAVANLSLTPMPEP